MLRFRSFRATSLILFPTNEPSPLWTIWRSISFLERSFFLALLAVSLYCLLSGVRINLRLRAIRMLNHDENRASIQPSLEALRTILVNVRQTIEAAFYLFGFVLFVNLATISNTIDDSKTPTGYSILENFLLQCAVAANAFLVFLTLHFVQWFVTRQVNSWAERLKAL